jgi:TonB family protein
MKKTSFFSLCVILLLVRCVSFAQQPVEVDTLPKVKEAYLPHYPLLPSGARESGEVTVSLILDESGKVTSAAPSGASEGLRREAERAARRWRFGDKTKKASLIFAFTLFDKGATGCLPSITFGNQIRIEVCEQRKAVVVISDPPLVDQSKPKKP